MKPDFFKDEDLAEFPFWIRLLYEGLWCHADKEGRLEDRPLRLRAEIFPYKGKFERVVDIEVGLRLLAQPKKHSPNHPPFIVRYEIEGGRFIQIVAWEKHESPHHTERDSQIPPYNGEVPVKEPIEKGRMQSAHEQGTMNLSPKSDPLKKVPDPSDIRLVQFLIDLMLKNNPESSIIKKLTSNRQAEWIDQCRLLREADGKAPAEIERVIAFSQTDNFWKANILSMPKLREKWDQLWMKAQQGDPLAGLRDWLAKKEKENAGK